SERVITASVEALWIKAAEVAHPRQRDIDQPVEKLIHAGFAQGHLAADRLSGAYLVSRDRLACFRHHRLLTGDQSEIGRRAVDLLAIAHALADSHVDDDLIEPWNLIPVLVPELLGERAADGLVELQF